MGALSLRFPLSGLGVSGSRLAVVASVLFLCTGNATRSVLAARLLAELRPDVEVASAGTLVLPGRPMSWRTRAAFEAIGLAVPEEHRSAQAGAGDLEAADLIIGMEPSHISWVRREYPAQAGRAGTLIRLVGELAPGPVPSLVERVEALGLGSCELSPEEEVVDPGGGEVEEFVACVHELQGLVGRLAPLI